MIIQRSTPVIVGFVADLYFAQKIEQVIENYGYTVKWIETFDQVTRNSSPVSVRQYAEHLVGPGADLIEIVAKLQPVLIIFDLNNNKIPWYEWITLLKSAPATRRIPVLAYGPHVDTISLKSARGAGADIVLPRSKFIKDLDDLIRDYVRIPDLAAVDKSCDQGLSEIAIKGLEEFNKGQYFEAHELLEEAWNKDQPPGKELYRAILQVAVAYLQIERGNFNGAMKMFLRMRQWFALLPENCRGVDVGQLRMDADEVYSKLIELGADQIGGFQQYKFKPIKYSLK
jgi:CheY-like chemotaxis protein